MKPKRSELNRLVLHEMKKIYYGKDTPYLDWMGYKIDDDNKPSYHHITKKADLKKEKKDSYACVENGAYLGKHSHELLHRIEIVDQDLYDSWNYLFLVINKMGIYPIEDVWKQIYFLQEQSEQLLGQDAKTLRKLRKETAQRKKDFSN